MVKSTKEVQTQLVVGENKTVATIKAMHRDSINNANTESPTSIRRIKRRVMGEILDNV